MSEYELIKINNNQIVVDEETIEQIKELERTKLRLDLMHDKLREEIQKAMEKLGASDYVSPDGSLSAHYYPEKTTKRFSSKKLKEELPDVYNEYMQDSVTKAYIKLSVK